MVATLRGDIDPGDLGVTLMHEHLFVVDTELRANYPETWDEATQIELAVERLNAAHARGVTSIVDVTVLGLGRSIPRMVRVAARTPVNVIAATGLYSYDLVPLSLRSDADRQGDVGLMADLFTRDIEVGISDTGVRAGALKCASDRYGVTPGCERAIRAVARAQRATGVPILTHTNVRLDPRGGLDQIAVLSSEQADLARVVIGHSDDSPDFDYLCQLAESGAYVGFDHFNTVVVTPTLAERAEMLLRLIERGHLDRLIISHDSWCFAESYGNSGDFTLIHDTVLPMLRARGLGEGEIAALLVDNPRRLFA